MAALTASYTKDTHFKQPHHALQFSVLNKQPNKLNYNLRCWCGKIEPDILTLVVTLKTND